MEIVDELYKLIDSTEFSDRVKDKVKELAIKAKLKKESGAEEKYCLTAQELDELMRLVKADMILDGLRAQACRAHLDEIDRLLDGLVK